MAEDRVQRRLAAILAADVVGYSSLMEEREAETLARFRRRRVEIIDPTVAEHYGKFVGSAGDSFLIEFGNALAAVQCAIACQRALERANANEPEQRPFLFRIGVNLGDVIPAEDTIHGDGVNVAARLERMAEPGGVCVARNVYDQVEGKLDVRFSDLGEHKVKNIAKPVRVYRAELQDVSQDRTASPSTDRRSGKVSIAVLPFDNMSGDSEQVYFSDGIAEDIITELSRFRELLVIARNSSFQFRGKSVDIRGVADKLGVQFVVEGSVRRGGNRIRVNVQLIDAATTAHIWAERYDRDLTDVFEIQDEITRMVVAQVVGHARAAVVDHNRSRPTDNLSAYDYFLRARQVFTPHAGAFVAEPFLMKALELDPNLGVAHAMLAHLHCVRFYYDGNWDHLTNALASAGKALDLDPEEPWPNYAQGISLLFSRRFGEAEPYFEKALALNGNEVRFLAGHALFLGYMKRTDLALREIDEALRRDPYSHEWFWDVRGAALTAGDRYLEAIDSFRHVKRPPPWCVCYLAVCHALVGQMAEAKAMLAKFHEMSPGRTLEELMSKEPISDPESAKRLIDAARRTDQAD